MGATKIFIRFPKTFFETEDAFQRGKNRLATIIQKIYKGRLQRRQYLKMRTACISVQVKISVNYNYRLSIQCQQFYFFLNCYLLGFFQLSWEKNGQYDRFIGDCYSVL